MEPRKLVQEEEEIENYRHPMSWSLNDVIAGRPDDISQTGHDFHGVVRHRIWWKALSRQGLLLATGRLIDPNMAVRE